MLRKAKEFTRRETRDLFATCCSRWSSSAVAEVDVRPHLRPLRDDPMKRKWMFHENRSCGRRNSLGAAANLFSRLLPEERLPCPRAQRMPDLNDFVNDHGGEAHGQPDAHGFARQTPPSTNTKAHHGGWPIAPPTKGKGQCHFPEDHSDFSKTCARCAFNLLRRPGAMAP
jgi:hypothetical protein